MNQQVPQQIATKIKSDAHALPSRAHILVYCDSFNPVTNLHLRLIDVVHDHYEHVMIDCHLLGVILSPVHSLYDQESLSDPTIPLTDHRLAMLRISTQQYHTVYVDDWECVSQPNWTPTFQVLQHYQHSLTQVCSSLQGHTASDAKTSKDILSSGLGKCLSGWLMNYLPGQSSNDMSSPSSISRISVRLLSNSHLLTSMLDSKIWPETEVRQVLNEFGLTCVRRNGFQADKLVYENNIFYQYRRQIELVHDWLSNSTDVRDFQRALRRGENVQHLIPAVVLQYIHRHGLYETRKYIQTIGTCSDSQIETALDKRDKLSLKTLPSKDVATQTRLTAIGEQSSWLVSTPSSEPGNGTIIGSSTPEQTIQRLLRICQECGSKRARFVLIEHFKNSNGQNASSEPKCEPLKKEAEKRIQDEDDRFHSSQLIEPTTVTALECQASKIQSQSTECTDTMPERTPSIKQQHSQTVSSTSNEQFPTNHSSSGSSSSGTRKLERDIELILQRLQTHDDANDYL